MEYLVYLHGLDCPNCAKKLENKYKEIEGIADVEVKHPENTLHFVCDEENKEEILKSIKIITKELEEDVVVSEQAETQDTCSCGCHEHHEHHEHHNHHHEDATYKFRIKGLDCANCAAKLERKIAEIEGISNVRLNFMQESLEYDCEHDEAKGIEEKVRALIKQEEDGVELINKGHSHHHDYDHEHEHHEENIYQKTSKTHQYRIEGLDCENCAKRIEDKIQKINGVENAQVSYIHSKLLFDCKEEDFEVIKKEIFDLVAKEEPEAKISDFSKHNIEEKEESTMMIRLIVGALFFILSLFLKDNVKIILSLLAYIVLGYDVILKAIKNIGRGQIFDENFLMTVATIAAIYLQEYSEAAGVMLFYQIGEYFQDLAVRRSRKSIAELMNIRSEHATVIRDGKERIVHPEEVDVGEIIYVKAGEKVPLDGVILEGKSRLNMASLTGESLPKDVEEGNEILSGSVNESGLLKVRVNKPYSDSTVMKILELIENSENKKASHEAFITKFAKYYTPIVVLTAIFTAIISAIVLKDIQEGIRRACTFLVISCPCALVISVPLSFFAGIGGLSKKGILVKGADIIEKLAVIKEVIFDKTGTITNGEFEVSEIVGKDKEKILEYAAMVEQYSHHPLSLAIEKAYTKNTFPYDAKDIQEIAGRGMVAMIEGKKVYVGNQKLMLENGIKDIVDTKGTVIHVAIEDEYLGYISLKDGLKKGMTSVIDQLKNMNITTAMVSGDAKEIVDEIRQEVGIEKAVGECLPEDKVRYIQKRKEECKVAFVGDGVNDAPVLVEADVGLSMGAIGSDAAIEASDVVLMDDDITKVKMAMDNSRRIVAVAKQNIYGAILIKVITLILGAFGIANMWMAIFADTGVALLCVLNALRLLNAKE